VKFDNHHDDPWNRDHRIQPEAFEEKPDLENLLSAAWVKYVSKRATAA
jgi:hypothetical protein